MYFLDGSRKITKKEISRQKRIILTHLPDIYVEKPDQHHFEANAIVWFLDPNTNPEWPRPSLKAFLAASL